MKAIYIITNSMNDSVYVGCTSKPLHRRFMEHVFESRRERSKNRPFYIMMRKIGIDKFAITKLEDCNDDDATTCERKWIKYYQDADRCCNIALGGAGKPLFDHNEIIAKLRENPYPTDIASQTGCSRCLIRQVAAKNKLTIKNKGQQTNVNAPKRVCQFSLDNSFIQEHNSVKSAVDWCVENNKCKSQSSSARGHISDCANGKVKTAFGYIWKYQW